MKNYSFKDDSGIFLVKGGTGSREKLDRLELPKAEIDDLQENFYKAICPIVSIDDFPKMYEDHAIKYGLPNYIAKYNLAKDSYLITEMSLKHVPSKKFIRYDDKLRRCLTVPRK